MSRAQRRALALEDNAMVRRWASLSILAIGCSTGWGRSAQAPAKVAPPPSVPYLVFGTVQGTAPLGQVVRLRVPEGAPEPAVSIAYTGVGGWLSAGAAGDGEWRSLSVQPLSHRLGPGIYRASIDMGDRRGELPGRIEVTLAISGYSHASCPPGSTLRYAGGGDGGREPADFGKRFFGTYCTGCHGSAVVGGSRSGAPPDLNWDTPSIIREQRFWIDAVAGRGPDGSNDDMPPEWVPLRPAPAERELLAQWIACGTP